MQSKKTTAGTPGYKAKQIYDVLKSRNIRLACLFVASVLPVVDKPNLLLQKEEAYIHKLYPILRNLVKDMLVRFVKPSVISGEEILEVQYKVENNQKANEDLVIGEGARKFIEEQGEGKLDLQKFYAQVKSFYVAFLDYVFEKLPLKDETIFHAQVADTKERCSQSFTSVKFLIAKFPCILPKGVELDTVEDEFLNYQVADLSKHVQESMQMDLQWHVIGTIKDEEKFMFKNLAHVMLSILCIYHSNAPCERVFSMVTQNKTPGRASLATKTLESLLIRKVGMAARGCPCFQSQYSKSLLTEAKSATYVSLTQAKSAT